MERAEEERGSCLGLRDELNSPPSPFSSVTESYIMNNFWFLYFMMCRRLRVILIPQQRHCQSLKGLSGHWWSRTRCREGLLGSWRRQCLRSEKEFRAFLFQLIQKKAGMYSRVKPRERVKAHKNVRQMNKLRCEIFEVKIKFLEAEW